MPLAKGLGSGVPIGAVVAHGPAANLFGPGNHGTTFGGNPLAMRAGIETIDAIARQGLLDNAIHCGDRLRTGFAEQLRGLNGVREIRGQGLMIGIELDRPCTELVATAREAGLLINVTADHVIRLLPALIINETECDQIVAILSPVIRTFLQQGAS